MIWEFESSSEEDTIAIGAALGKRLRPGDVLYLMGDLGSGKTRLAKGIVSSATGVSPDDVASPTFTLVNSFDGAFQVHHADLYRIEAGMVDDIGLEDAVDQGGALIVEWAEKVAGLFDDPLLIAIERSERGENSRRIVFRWTPSGSWSERMKEIIPPVQ
jgi:tRNA threonylcarbamoyladenosine biosynthesis protein TsaE